MLERDLVRRIKTYLSSLEGCFSWKEHGGMYGTAGIPDIICCYRGRFVAFEVKVPGNPPTPLQKSTLEKIRRAGGTAEVVQCLDEVKATLEKMEVCHGEN